MCCTDEGGPRPAGSLEKTQDEESNHCEEGLKARFGVTAEELESDDDRQPGSGKNTGLSHEPLCGKEHPGNERKDVCERPGKPGDHEQPEPIDGPAEEGPCESHVERPCEEEAAHCCDDDLRDRDDAQRPPER